MPHTLSIPNQPESPRKYDRAEVNKLRRRMLLGALACAAQPVLAQSPVPTPEQTEGPFYPDRLPLDRDNDLTRVEVAPFGWTRI
jgi:hypothetical protein